MGEQVAVKRALRALAFVVWITAAVVFTVIVHMGERIKRAFA